MQGAVRFQDPGEGIREAEVVEILVSPGDEVDEGQVILVVETDKANFDVQSPQTGVVEKVAVSVGDTIEVGDVLLRLEGEGAAEGGEEAEADGGRAKGGGGRPEGEEAPAARAEQEEQGQQKEQKEKPKKKKAEDEPAESGKGEAAATGSAEPSGAESRAPAQRRDDVRSERGAAEDRSAPVPASPATRRVARELGIDLHDVTPSGEGGRVLTADVRAFAEAPRRAREPGPQRRQSPLPDFERFGPVERVPLRSVRRTIARRMAEAWATIPHVTHGDEADVTELEAFRRRHSGEEEGEAPLTLTGLVVKAVASVLREFPRFNASLDADAEELVYKHYRHVGVAVDTDRGLLVPTLREVDRKSLRELGRELASLSERARNGELSREDMAGASFTVTNVGALGGTYFTPIINPPQVAILGLGRARWEPRVVSEGGGREPGRVVPRRILPLCLAFDHRVNDGADAARFASRLVELLSDPERLALNV